MVNCNPETVSTDYDTSDRLYFEPLDTESVLAVCEREKPDGVVIQFGGQTPLKLARAIEDAGYRILGTPFDAVDLAEDRERFAGLLRAHGLRSPEWGIAASPDEAVEIAERDRLPGARPAVVRARRPRDARLLHGGRGARDAAVRAGARRPLRRERGRGRRRRTLRRRRHVHRGGHAARRGGGRPLRRLGLRPAGAEPELRADGGDRARRSHPRALARRRRAAQRPARGHGRRRASTCSRRTRARRGRCRSSARRPGVELVKAACRLALGATDLGARAAARASAEAVERQGCGAAVRTLPGQRPGARPGDALDRRGDGERRRPLDRARQGRARSRAEVAALRLRLHLDPRARPAAGRADRGDARRPRLRALRDRGNGRDARGGGHRGRAGAEAQRGGCRRADGRRPDPPRPLRPRHQHAGGPQRALGRLRDPRGGARAARAVHHDAVGRRRGRARDRDTRAQSRPSRSRSGSMQSRARPAA